MGKDYYATLGVDKRADEKDIKAAYRKLARKYHPDVNPGDAKAEATFKEISQAYEVLGDPEKRKLYDQYGSNWEQAQHFQGAGGEGGFNFNFGGQPGGGGFETIFEQFFGGGGGMAGADYAQRGQPARDIEKAVELTLEEIDSGTQRTLTYQAPDACKTCDGNGWVEARTSQRCEQCNGTGKVRGLLGMAQPCGECGGRGVTGLQSCPTCKGSGTLATTKKVEVKIPAGIMDGKKLRVPGKGVMGSSGRAGDLYVLIRERQHPTFRRSGDALETEVEVPYHLAALGGEVKVPTLRAHVAMKVPEGAQAGQLFRLGGQGIARMNGQRSDLHVKLKIVVPKRLSAEEKRLLEQIRALSKETAKP